MHSQCRSGLQKKMQLSCGEIALTWIIAFAVATVFMVKGDYTIIVKTHYFNNPRSLLSNGSCCDVNETRGDGSCAVPGCDIVFHYCMGTTCRQGTLDKNTCRLSKITSYDEQGLNFSASTLLGLPNPLPLRGPTKEWTPYGVSLLVAVYDYDPNRDTSTQKYQPIFVSSICVPNLVGEEHWTTPVSGPPQSASMSLSIRVLCAENYYGPDCSQYCASNCTCDPGYTGSNCEININECKSMSITCSNRGECVDGINNFACDCDEGFTGEICHEIDDCLGVNCSGNGVCVDGVDSFLCQCETGYSGTLCDESEEIQSSGFQLGPLVGGTLGILVTFLHIFILVLAIVLIMRYHNRQREANIKGKEYSSTDTLPGDSSVYDGGYVDITPVALHTSAPGKKPLSDAGQNMSDDATASDLKFKKLRAVETFAVYSCPAYYGTRDSVMSSNSQDAALDHVPLYTTIISSTETDHDETVYDSADELVIGYDGEEKNTYVYADPYTIYQLGTRMESYNEKIENVYTDECAAFGSQQQRQTEIDSIQQELNNTYDYIDAPTCPKDKNTKVCGNIC